MPPNSASMSRRACVAIAFIVAPPSPIRIARWLGLSTQHDGADAAQLALLLEAARCTTVVAYGTSSPSRRKIFSRIELGREEALVAVGERRRRRRAPAPRAARVRSPPCSASSCVPFSRRHRHERGEIAPRRELRERAAAARALSASASTLLTATTTRARRRAAARRTSRSAGVSCAASIDQHDDVDVGEALPAPCGSAGR